MKYNHIDNSNAPYPVNKIIRNFYILEILRIDYSLLILSTNSSGVSISILEKPNHFLPKSFMDAPM